MRGRAGVRTVDMRCIRRFSGLLGFLLGSVTAHAQTTCSDTIIFDGFGAPESVSIQGYDGDAMEPFISRDGHYLFFNDLNQPNHNTNLHAARRLDDTTFDYLGEIAGVNTSHLEGVPTMDAAGRFYFVSTRRYATTLATLYWGRFEAGRVREIDLVPGIAPGQPGMVNFDIEVSAAGRTLYIVDARFNHLGQPETADLVIATAHGETFRRLPDSAALMQHINTAALEYAAAISRDELELFFTRAPSPGQTSGSQPRLPQIYRAWRPDPTAPFGCAAWVSALSGFVEAPTFAADEQALYFHQGQAGHFSLWRVARIARS